MPVELAQLNVAVMVDLIDSPRMSEFVAQLPEVNAAAEGSDGFLWRLKDDDGPDATGYRMLDNDMLIVNMSVWRDLESLRRFVIEHVSHRTALSRRRDWFERPADPMTVCWWVQDGHRPSVAEAEAMLLRLRSEGPSDELFPFTYRG